MSGDQAPRKHHFVPVFYTQRWAGDDGRLCEYSRPFRKVKPRRTHPDGTGYEHGLYSLRHLKGAEREIVETSFLKKTDNDAADALDWMLGQRALEPMNSRLRDGWSRFLMSMTQRSPARLDWIVDQLMTQLPETLEKLRKVYPDLRKPGDPDFEEYRAQRMAANNRSDFENTRALFMQHVSDLENVGTFINNMSWRILRLGSRHRWNLLTSDRPVIMTNGLRYEHSYIVMPLGPSVLFVAANNDTTHRQLEAMSNSRDFTARTNETLVAQAERFVYGTDDSHLRFVEKHFRRHDQPPVYAPHPRGD